MADVRQPLATQTVLNVKDFLAVGDGTTDDTVALTAAFAAIVTDSVVVFPKGVYKTDGTLTFDAAHSKFNVTFDFQGGELAPTTGWALKISRLHRGSLRNPIVRLQGGSIATRGIWLEDFTSYISIHEPEFWSYQNLPAGFTCIDVENNSYWCRIYNPRCDRYSPNTGKFATFVRFKNLSNRGSVFQGSINACDVGVLVDGTNTVAVDGTAFETVTSCVKTIDPTVGTSTNAGLTVQNCVLENVTYGLDIAQTVLPAAPITAFVYRNNGLIGGTAINNPNNIPVYAAFQETEGFWVSGNDKAFVLRNGNIKMRDQSGNAFFESKGSVNFVADSSNLGAGDTGFWWGGYGVGLYFYCDYATKSSKFYGNVIPSAAASKDLGTTALTWRAAYLDTQLNIAGNKVLGPRGATIANAAGGSVIDVEARATLNALLARLRATGGHGLISD